MARADSMIQMTGDKKLASTLLKLPVNVFIGVIRPATRKGVNVVKKEAKLNAKPGAVLSDKASGEMRKAIRSKTTANKNKETVSGRVFVTRKNKVVIDGKLHNPGAVAHLVEFGHGGPHPARPHPFLRPALDEKRTEAFQAVATEARKRLPKAVQKAKKITKANAIKALKNTTGKGLLRIK